MKYLTFILLAFALSSQAQKAMGKNQTMASAWIDPRKDTIVSLNSVLFGNDDRNIYPDTLKCYFHQVDENWENDNWQLGYIILKEGFIRSGGIAWRPNYAPMALGAFDNTFLFEDKTRVPGRNKVIQLIIIKQPK